MQNKPDIGELTDAMNKLADALNDTNALIREMKQEHPDWVTIPQALLELSKRLKILSTRL